MKYTNFKDWRTGALSEMEVNGAGRVVIAPRPTGSSVPGATDLGGKILMPKFIDAHCHILPTGLDMQKLNLRACTTKEEVLDAVRDEVTRSDREWILAVQYDQNKFADGKHITRTELDAICSDRPVLLRHYNGHGSVANTAAFAAIGVGKGTPDPQGGVYERDPSGELTGLALEMAHERLWEGTPAPTVEDMQSAIAAACDSMASMNIGCASDMMTGRFHLEKELEAYASDNFSVATRLYVQWRDIYGPKGIGIERFREHVHALQGRTDVRIAGVKLFCDGAIGGATAAIYGSYSGAKPTKVGAFPPNQTSPADGTSGQLIYAPSKLAAMIKRASDDGFQVAVHAIGDYATDIVLDAFEATGDPERHRLEHAMILSDAQIERIAKLNCFVNQQPEFLHHFGHAYRRQLGDERASMLNRTRSLIDAGVRVSFGSDRPIVPGNPEHGLACAVQRPEGFSQSENISHSEAVVCFTERAAEINGDSGVYGTLNAGEVASFQLRDK